MVALLGRRSHPSRVSGGLVRDDELLVWPDGGLVRGAGGELLGRQDGDLVKDDEILVWPDGGFVRDNELLVLIETVPIVNHRTEKARELGAEPIAKSCLERLAGVDLIYVSFDVDSMDSTISMAAGAPAPNGPSVEEARSINAVLCADPRVCRSGRPERALGSRRRARDQVTGRAGYRSPSLP
jgi:hypothetical protein